ncbi:hypothetical protein [Sulfurimonas sp.]|uniref:hypothetical protein n=1 Tax=Sulfurimonas sp. TaxID=2022749 RepID=UPI0026388A13|nr:hypothetical protein [Sulfurimonas sp.]
MKKETLELIEPTPILHSKKCKITAFSIKTLLQFATPIVALIAWYLYDYFIAGATLLITFIVVGIIRAKIRNAVIPLHQREYQYDDASIAAWYTAKELCIDTNPITSNESLLHNAEQKD